MPNLCLSLALAERRCLLTVADEQFSIDPSHSDPSQRPVGEAFHLGTRRVRARATLGRCDRMTE